MESNEPKNVVPVPDIWKVLLFYVGVIGVVSLVLMSSWYVSVPLVLLVFMWTLLFQLFSWLISYMRLENQEFLFVARCLRALVMSWYWFSHIWLLGVTIIFINYVGLTVLAI